MVKNESFDPKDVNVCCSEMIMILNLLKWRIRQIVIAQQTLNIGLFHINYMLISEIRVGSFP